MHNTEWKTYEEVAAFLLHRHAKEFGLSKVEGKQSVKGNRSETDWEIDAKGFNDNGVGFVIVECRRYTKSKQNQEQMAALAYRIEDTGASGGIIVSPLGLQLGAEKVASAENILEVKLSADSTPNEFAMSFLNKLMIGMVDTVAVSDSVIITLSRACKKCGKQFEVLVNESSCPNCIE